MYFFISLEMECIHSSIQFYEFKGVYGVMIFKISHHRLFILNGVPLCTLLNSWKLNLNYKMACLYLETNGEDSFFSFLMSDSDIFW